MQSAGMVSGNRNALAEAGMGLLSPVTLNGAQKVGGLLYGAESNALANLAKPSTMVNAKQRGALAWHGSDTKNNMDAPHLQDLISSQKYLDRDVVAQKIKEGNFDVRVSPRFDVEGEQVRAILDGHHALEAAIRSGNKPNFIEQSARDNDTIGLLRNGAIDDFLGANYMDAPWYRFASKADIW
jgi:hypothetical protein